MAKADFEEVAHYPLAPEQLAALHEAQAECTFIWQMKDGWPMGVIMNYVWRDDRCWLTASSQRPRMAAIRRDNRVSIVISSFGTPLGMQALTYRGRCTIRDDAATKAWFYPALAKRLSPDSSEGQQGFVTMLDTPRRVILEVVPERTVSFDGNRLLSEANG